MKKKTITRFAPSPTGLLHVGGLRTALYAYLFAKQRQGSFLLRIEDTDQTRLVPGAEDNILETLKRFGLEWDNDTLMRQSERLAVYREHALQLIESNAAYYCFCTPERLEQVRTQQQAAKQPTRYDGTCRSLKPKEAAGRVDAGESYVIRFAMPTEGVTVFEDAIRGVVSFSNALVDDQVLLKSDGFPTYHLASVVDDRAMEITHIIRGEEWLSSTPKHVLLYEAFGWDAPTFAHLPLLLNTDRSKLSKRQGDVAVTDYLAKGYLPDALLNFVLLLGWNTGTDQEMFTRDEMIEQFSFDRIHKSGAVFDLKKLDWINGMYIRHANLDRLVELAMPFLAEAGIAAEPDRVKAVIEIEKERLSTLAELPQTARFFFERPKPDAQLLPWKNESLPVTKSNLELAAAVLQKVDDADWSAATLEHELKQLIVDQKKSTGELLWPLRVALCGQKNSPGPFEIAGALGKTETLTRLGESIAALNV